MASLNSKCSGCGAGLQSNDEAGPGYIPENLLTNNGEKLVCKRCHRIKHYNEILKIDLNEENFTDIIRSIPRENSLILYIVDIFDLEGSWLEQIPQYLSKHKIYLVVNKIDLLPRDAKIGKLRQYMQNYLKSRDLRAQKIFFLSANKKWDLEYILEDLQKEKNKKIYMIGSTNVGKSTLINVIAPLLQGKESGKFFDMPDLTSSIFSGTTVECLRIPITSGQVIYDTPGIIRRDRLIEDVCKQCLTKIIPKSQIKPKIYQLDSQQTLYIEGLARLDYLEGSRQSFVCYFSNEIKIHRTKYINADEFFKKHYKKLISPPCDMCSPALDKWRSHDIRLEEDSEIDIVISGLGWITVKGQSMHMRLQCAENISITVRPALI